MELRRLSNQSIEMAKAVNSQQQSPSADHERIDIFGEKAYHRDETAFIDQHSPCSYITFQKLIELEGPQVSYVKAEGDNPHQHHGLVGTKLLQLESAEFSNFTEEIFCIVTHADHPIVLNISLRPTRTKPSALPIGGSVSKKKGTPSAVPVASQC